MYYVRMGNNAIKYGSYVEARDAVIDVYGPRCVEVRELIDLFDEKIWEVV